MPLSEEASSLINALAVELAWFNRKEKSGTDYPHLGISWFSMCDFDADPRTPRPCSARCQQVRTVLTLAAERLGCEVKDFQEGHKPKRTKTAVQTKFTT